MSAKRRNSTQETPRVLLGGDYWDAEPTAPLWGFADLHAHLMTHLAFGGRAFWGLLDGTSGCQVVWKRVTGGRFGLAALDPVPPDHLRWFYDRHALGVQPGDDSSRLIPVEELGPRIATVVGRKARRCVLRHALRGGTPRRDRG